MTTIHVNSPKMQRPVSAQFRHGLIMNFGPHLMQVKDGNLNFFTNSGAEMTSPPFTYTLTFSEPILAGLETTADAQLMSPTEFQLTTRLGLEPQITLLLRD